MAPVRFGLQIPAELHGRSRRATYVADVDRALDTIAGHFASAHVIDHLQFGDQDILEAFVTLTYFAARHPEFQFGHTVVCQSFRNPALVAKMGASLQLLTAGRFTLGLGAGCQQDEYRAYGYDFPSRGGVLVAQMEEAVQVIRALWTQAPATFTGQHHRIEHAYCEPRPDPVPAIMIGAFRPKMLRVTARHADDWNVSSTGPREYRRLGRELDRACADVGRDPASIGRSWCGGCAVAPTRAEAERRADGRCSPDEEDDYCFVGTPAQVIEYMRPFVELGITHFILDPLDLPDLTSLELLVTEVLPALNEGW